MSADLRNRLGLKKEEIAVLALVAALRAGDLDMVCFLRGFSTEEMGRMFVDMLKRVMINVIGIDVVDNWGIVMYCRVVCGQ